MPELMQRNNFIIPRHTLVVGYYDIPSRVLPYVRPSIHTFPIDNLSICLRIFFKFCIHSVIRDKWYGIVNGQNCSIFNRITALVHTAGFIRVREMSGKFKIFQGQGIVREFHNLSGKIEFLLKCQGNVREF